MKVLVACEYSGRVREAFRAKGHSAWSCDLLPSEDSSKCHIQAPVEDVLGDGWDLMVAHPPEATNSIPSIHAGSREALANPHLRTTHGLLWITTGGITGGNYQLSYLLSYLRGNQ